jgi:hypothetical protein
MKSMSELISQLAGHGVSINVEGNSLKLVRPPSLFSWEGAPEEVKALVRELKRRKQEVAAYLRGYVEELGNRYPVRSTRPRCMATEYCCWISENDCDLYPLMKDGKLSGLCRERIPERVGNHAAD